MGSPTDNSDFIVLLARQRSGTNALRSVVESHPEIFCFPEIFEPAPPATNLLGRECNYFVFLERLFDGDVRGVLTLDSHEQPFLDYLDYLRCFSDKRFLVLDVKYNSTHHVRRGWRFISEPPFLFELIRDQGMRVLHLTRQNFLRYYLSEAKAQQWHRWHTFDESVVGTESWFMQNPRATDVNDERVVIDPDHLLQMLHLCKSETHTVSSFFPEGDRCLTIDYDDLFEEIGAPISSVTLEKLAAWLDVDPAFSNARPKYKKQSDLPLTETVENFDEISDLLRGSEFEYCLEDERMYRPRDAAGFGMGEVAPS